MKGRPDDKPLLVLVDGIAMAETLAIEVPPAARALMARHWPGALTLVLRARPHVPVEVTAGSGTVGVRLSAHPVARALVQALGAPVTAPSANPSGLSAPTTAAEVRAHFGDRHRPRARRRADRRRRALHRRRRHGRAAARPAGGRRAALSVRVTGVIQAGGKSTRMGGRPKALLELGGRRIIERVLDAVAPVVDDVLVVTNTPDLYAFLRVPMVPDAWPEHGSLGGIFTGLTAAAGDAAFTVACDMPFLHPEVARLVVRRAGEGDVVIPRVGEQFETMHAVYAKSCLPAIEARLRAGRLKIVGFFEDVRVVEIAAEEVARHRAPEVAFMNVNTPEELERARELVAELG